MLTSRERAWLRAMPAWTPGLDGSVSGDAIEAKYDRLRDALEELLDVWAQRGDDHVLPSWRVHEREEWDASCHFCGGSAYPWLTDDETWAKVEPLMGQEQACFECFAAAWFALGLNDGEPFTITCHNKSASGLI